jgi:exosortase
MKHAIKTPAALAALREPSNLLLAAKAATIAVAAIILYLQDLALVFNDALKNEATSYILVVPLLLVYLMYRKRKMLRATMSTKPENQPKNTHHIPTLTGILLCITAIILYWYGSYTFTPLEYHILTLPIFTAGLTLIFFNPQTLRQALFPIAFLAFLTPPPSEILYGLGSTLSVISSEASTAIVNLFGIPATLTGEYGTPTIIVTRPDSTTMSFAVDIACSGIYSLIGFLIFAAFIAFIVRDKLWKKAATFMIGFPLIYLLNILRITIIVGIGYQFGEQLALDMFHLLGGWILIFLGTLILLTISERIFKTRIFNRKQDTCLSCTSQFPSPTGTYCHACGRITKYPRANPRKTEIAKIAAVALTTILLLSIQSPVFALTQGPAQILIQTPTSEQGNTQIFPNITGYTLQFLYRDTEFEQTSKQDLSLIYFYAPQEEDKEPVWVALEIADTTLSLHRWETCLITWPQTSGYQPGVTQLELTDTTILENPPIIARYFGFQYHRDNQTQLVLYWYETSVFTIDNTSQQKHVKLSLITYPESPDSIPNIKPQLLPIAKAMADYWQPIKTWTFISMTLSRQGLQIATATAAFIIALSAFYILELKRQTTANANAYRKLSQQNQQLFNAIQKTQRTTLPTINRISETYRTTTGDTITATQLEQRIAELEKTEIITSQITNDQDEPAHTWKPKTTFSLRKR